MIDLTEGETLVLLGEIVHGPDCEWSQPFVKYFMDSTGAMWRDEECTIPYKGHPTCSCGWWPLMRGARKKLRKSLKEMKNESVDQ
jgi:hypothetical protein